MFALRIILTTTLLFAMGACSENIDTSGGDEPRTFSPTPVENEDGTTSIQVDATSRTDWTLLNFDDGIVEADAEWDLAFRRFTVRVNGGGSGTGTGGGQLVDASRLAEVEIAPDGGWLTDGEEATELVMSDWYGYDSETHILTPVPGVWIIRRGSGQDYVALQVVSYYDDAGNSGVYSVAWKTIEPPETSPTLMSGTGQLPMPTDDPRAGAESEEMETSEGDSPDDSESAGCYSGPPNHMCDCALSEAQCDESGGTWTGDCECADE